MDKAAEAFVAGKRIAMVGVSRSGKKFGNIVLKELKERGFEPLLVHPTAIEIDGAACYPNLEALRGKADGVWVCVQPAETEKVVREASQAGFQKIWLQQGAETPAAVQAAKDLGMQMVSGKCILMYAPPVKAMHGVHRGFVRLFGKL